LAEALINKGYKIVSGGTDNHLMVVDLNSKGLAGKDAEIALENIGISVSRSTIPNDPNPPMNPSGIRIGTPAVTTRGMKELEMEIIADIMDQALISKDNKEELARLKQVVKDLCGHFPIYKNK